MQAIPQQKNPGLAAVLSVLINGLGQIYNGEIGKGLLIIVVQIVNVLLMAVVIGFFTGFAVFIWSVYDAYKTAERINQQYALQYQAMYGAGAAQPVSPPTVAYPQLNAPVTGPTQPATPSSQPLGAAGQKQCPRCAEMVQSAAKVCRYCSYEFEA